MKVTVTDIGTINKKGWLIIEDGRSKTTACLDVDEMTQLAEQIIWTVRKYAREQREWARSMEASLSEATQPPAEKDVTNG